MWGGRPATARNAAGLEPGRPASLFHFIPRRSSDQSAAANGAHERGPSRAQQRWLSPRCHRQQQFVNHIGVDEPPTPASHHLRSRVVNLDRDFCGSGPEKLESHHSGPQ
jgi:hypothetical protein